MAENTFITLKSSEDKQFKISEKAAKRAKVFNDLLEDYGKNENIPLEINSETLESVIKYLEHYENQEPKNIEKPLKSGDLTKVLDTWDYEFISKFSLEKSVDLVNAANYINLDSLLQLSLCRIASEMVDQPIEEVQKKFGIESDMTEEEKKKNYQYPLNLIIKKKI